MIRKGQHNMQERTPPNRKPANIRHIALSAALLAVGLLLVVGFFYLDRHNRIGRLIQSAGPFAVIASIVLMCIFCMLPVPSEFLIILNMKVFGVWWGVLYSWAGSLSGSIAVFLFARYIARDLLKRFIAEEHMRKVETWISQRGVMGLILVRIIPVPFIVVNYTAGVVRDISLWNFTWTSTVGGIPYYLAAGLLFLGFSKKLVVWLFVGGTAVLAIWLVGYMYRRKTKVKD